MDKKAIKTFAIESRKKLMDEVKYQASLLGITAEGINEPVEKSADMEVYDIGASTPHTIYDEAIKQRKSLVKKIKEKGFDHVIEEVAYTWFNRIIAIRFMEVNDYLPTRIRVLSSTTPGKVEPDIITEAPNIDLEFTEEEKDQIHQLKNDNKLDELFKLLFIKQCNKMNEILPELFEKTADYTELLLSISFTNEDGIIRQLIDSISEEDFTDQVEIIGWLYQYYNTELKDDTFKQLKKRVKISKERIPAATQLFTPDWIVRYMVENSLGRLWLEGHPDSNLKENWKYYLDEAEQEPEVQIELDKLREESKNLKPEDIKVIDPAMGSGHILVYAFDVLMQIYTSVGYSERDAAESILKNNLYGLDIDDRAYQLAYFAVMMKGQSYNRKILTKNIEPQICSIQESNGISDELIDFVADGDLNIRKDLRYLVEIFTDAKEYGSIIDINQIDFRSILNVLDEIKQKRYFDFKSIQHQKEVNNLVIPILKQFFVFYNKYDIVVTNPPYMSSSGMNKKIYNYVKYNYPKSKRDLFAVFMEKCEKMLSYNGTLSMITQHAFMFLLSYEKFREKFLQKDIINMIHLGSRAFEEIGGEVVQATSFVQKNRNVPNYKSIFVRLTDFNSQNAKENEFFDIKNRYITNQNYFTKIPGSPIAYWMSEGFYKVFSCSKKFEEYGIPKKGISTSNNELFLKFWFEVNKENCSHLGSMNKWFPYNKGGAYRKWYGNNDYIINWENNGYEVKNFKKSVVRNEQYFFREGASWTDLSSSSFSARKFDEGFIFDASGPCYFSNNNLLYLMGFTNCKICNIVLSIFNSTMHFLVSDIGKLPIIFSEKYEVDINNIVSDNIRLSKEDWDSFETSWDFKIHPLILFNESLIENSFNKWNKLTQSRFFEVKSNDERLNEIFIDIYNLKSELNPTVKETEIKINKANISRDIKSFISYSVGCMLGRYSLDKEGLIYAGGQWDPSKYSKFIPDDDNIIPILDTEYFEDDILGRFIGFVKVTFGKDTLEENLDFIAQALKKKGTTSREIIRNYFLTDFYKDHVKTYKKHPIYWQFDSGKNNGFKALIYMHRYEPDLVARVRTDYLHKTQKTLETAINHNDRIIESSNSASEKAKATKTKNKLFKQLEETRKYDEALAHIANQKIPIGLDDGVKINYAKFQSVEVSKEGKKTSKINLLTKI